MMKIGKHMSSNQDFLVPNALRDSGKGTHCHSRRVFTLIGVPHRSHSKDSFVPMSAVGEKREGAVRPKSREEGLG